MFLLKKNLLVAFVEIVILPLSGASQSSVQHKDVRYRFEKVDGLDIFFREAGDPSNPAIVLLHRFPTFSHMYREVLRGMAKIFT